MIMPGMTHGRIFPVHLISMHAHIMPFMLHWGVLWMLMLFHKFLLTGDHNGGSQFHAVPVAIDDVNLIALIPGHIGHQLSK